MGCRKIFDWMYGWRVTSIRSEMISFTPTLKTAARSYVHLLGNPCGKVGAAAVVVANHKLWMYVCINGCVDV